MARPPQQTFKTPEPDAKNGQPHGGLPQQVQDAMILQPPKTEK